MGEWRGSERNNKANTRHLCAEQREKISLSWETVTWSRAIWISFNSSYSQAHDESQHVIDFTWSHWEISHCLSISNNSPNFPGQFWIFPKLLTAFTSRIFQETEIQTTPCRIFMPWGVRKREKGGVGETEKRRKRGQCRELRSGWMRTQVEAWRKPVCQHTNSVWWCLTGFNGPSWCWLSVTRMKGCGRVFALWSAHERAFWP